MRSADNPAVENFVLVAAIALCLYVLNSQDQRRRIALLGSHLGRFQIEKLMESLTQGYLRCLDESDADRRAQIWSMLHASEEVLADQFRRFALDFGKVDEAQARVSRIPFAFPFADRLFPAATFDARQAFAIHARGIADAAANVLQQTPAQRAFMLSAELFLKQHTCHWYCRSKVVASARLLARHKTSHQLALDSVAPATRAAYRSLTGI
jgi:hypothetical protein